MTATIHFPQGQRTTEWHFGRGLLEGALLSDLCKKYKGRPFIISDNALKRLGGTLAAQLSAEAFFIDSGEKAKTAKTKEKIENALSKAGYGNDTVIIALGGGTVTDTVGFTASTYHRGVPLILIPTTLLAIVDASIGGKNGINTKYGKNQIGTLYPPKAVIADMETLRTLPESEWRYGMAEIVKIGLAANGGLFAHLGNAHAFDTLVREASLEKMKIVEKDPQTLGLRNVLNFGHTIGHSLEHLSRYTLPHGTAVAIGTMTEAYLSVLLGYLPQQTFEEILTLQPHLGPLSLPSKYSRSAAMKAMLKDKKTNGNGIHFVCIEGTGIPVPFDGKYCRPVEATVITQALKWMEKTYG